MSYRKKKILIAGGGGYIGTELSNDLDMRGHDVTVVDLFWFGNYLNDNIKIMNKNLMELKEEDVSEYDAVVFLAGLSNDPMANFSPSKNFIENAAAPTYLAFISKQAGIPRFVYASSCSVYGFTDNEVMDEESPVNPQYPYGISKLQGEYAIMKMADEAFRPIAMRKGTVGGWSARMRFDLVVNTMTKYALSQGKITVHNPNLWRPLIDIRDVVTAYRKAIMCSQNISEVFNICGENYTIGRLANDVVNEFAKIGTKIDVEVQSRPDVRNYLASNTKAKRMLEFTPEFEPADSIQQILQHVEKENIDLGDKRHYNIQTFMDLENES
jgi:nucleoside-diphosphate-sugar epimerase